MFDFLRTIAIGLVGLACAVAFVAGCYFIMTAVGWVILTILTDSFTRSDASACGFFTTLGLIIVYIIGDEIRSDY